MNALATAPGVIATPGKYYIGAQEVMEYLDCKSESDWQRTENLLLMIFWMMKTIGRLW